MWSLVLEDRCASIAGTWSGQDLKGHLGQHLGLGVGVVAWETQNSFCVGGNL